MHPNNLLNNEPEENSFSPEKVNINQNEKIILASSKNQPKQNKVFKRSPETRAAISKALKGKKKNKPGYWLGKKGKENPNYIHGKGANREVDCIKYNSWITGVKAKDQYKCFITGETIKSKLQCHHLLSWEHTESRYDIKNGILINKTIHAEFHKIYGYGDNTPEQFEEFIKKKYNITVYPWRQGNHEPSLSVEEISQLKKTAGEKKMIAFQELCSSRKHKIVSGTYQNAQSKVTIFCEKHDEQYVTTFTNYKKSRTGLKCCGRESQIDKAKNYERDSKGKFQSL